MPPSHMALWGAIARGFMGMRECLVANRRPELNEEAVADLQSCLMQQQARCEELQGAIEACEEKIRARKALMDRERSAAGKKRELSRCNVLLKERRQMQADMDKSAHIQSALRRQIESIKTSHMDALIVDAMRTYSMTAARMGLPNRVREIEGLAKELEERCAEAASLQDVMGEVMAGYGADAEVTAMDDDELMEEIESIAAAPADDCCGEREAAAARPDAKRNAEDATVAGAIAALAVPSAAQPEAGARRRPELEAAPA